MTKTMKLKTTHTHMPHKYIPLRSSRSGGGSGSSSSGGGSSDSSGLLW